MEPDENFLTTIIRKIDELSMKFGFTLTKENAALLLYTKDTLRLLEAVNTQKAIQYSPVSPEGFYPLEISTDSGRVIVHRNKGGRESIFIVMHDDFYSVFDFRTLELISTEVIPAGYSIESTLSTVRFKKKFEVNK